MNGPPFANRREAGRALARQLVPLQLPPPCVVLALPRGGVPVAAEVARALHAPLDLLLVRKIGLPWQPELALAAGSRATRPTWWSTSRCSSSSTSTATTWTRRCGVSCRRSRASARPPAGPRAGNGAGLHRDPGRRRIATGTTVRAALKALRRRGPARLVLAVPVAPDDTLQALAPEVDQIVCLARPRPFRAVGEHYLDFDAVDDAEVIEALDNPRSKT